MVANPFSSVRCIASCLILVMMTLRLQAGVNITMWQVDQQHTGQNLNETILTPSFVGSSGFGFLFSQNLDGQVFGQPLIVSGLTINGATHNVVYMVTENDGVYAFDADSNAGSNSTYLWYDSLLPA